MQYLGKSLVEHQPSQIGELIYHDFRSFFGLLKKEVFVGKQGFARYWKLLFFKRKKIVEFSQIDSLHFHIDSISRNRRRYYHLSCVGRNNELLFKLVKPFADMNLKGKLIDVPAKVMDYHLMMNVRQAWGDYSVKKLEKQMEKSGKVKFVLPGLFKVVNSGKYLELRKNKSIALIDGKKSFELKENEIGKMSNRGHWIFIKCKNGETKKVTVRAIANAKAFWLLLEKYFKF